jgi:Cell division protein CrgA
LFSSRTILSAMPKSKGRTRKNKGYQLRPSRKKRAKKSPRWYGPTVLAVMGVGVLVIVLNYMNIMPGTKHSFNAIYLVGGLVLIGLGFVGTTFWT